MVRFIADSDSAAHFLQASRLLSRDTVIKPSTFRSLTGAVVVVVWAGFQFCIQQHGYSGSVAFVNMSEWAKILGGVNLPSINKSK